MPGPNDFHFDKGVLKPGLGAGDPRNGTATLREAPRPDGRTAEAKRLKALDAMAEKLDAEREALRKEKAEFAALKGAK